MRMPVNDLMSNWAYMVSAPLSLLGWGWLWRQRHAPQRLAPAMGLAIAAAAAHGLALAAGVLQVAWV